MRLAVVHNRELQDEDFAATLDLPGYTRAAPPTIFVTVDPSLLLATLDDAFCEHSNWHYTLNRISSEFGELGISRVKLRTFGFRGEGERKQRLHQCWNPNAISPTPLHRLLEGDITHDTLMAWAQDVRAWAQEQDLELRNAFAGYASQLLRDKRFYPEPRRRVPRRTNERARELLPGNLITLHVPPGPTGYNVTAIDQRQAHHRIVQQIEVPDANTLFARGYFAHPEDAPEYWAPRGTELYERTMLQPGLLFVGMHSRPSLKNEFRLPVQEHQGYRRVYLWANTVPFIESTGSRIDGIYAAWTSTLTDSGLRRYGSFAQSQIETALPARKRWLKPLLHSTYGLLAARPRPIEVGHRKARGGKSSHFLLGAREFPVLATQLREWQPSIANVIQRGVIEAETQVRSLHMAQELTNAGCRVLHIHTDGLHVQGELPLLPQDWGINALTSTMYMDRVSWVALEKQCLPGRDAQLRHELIQHYGQLHATLSATRKARGLRGRLQRTKERTNVGPSKTGESR